LPHDLGTEQLARGGVEEDLDRHRLRTGIIARMMGRVNVYLLIPCPGAP
jgi:hypothetical protein